MQHPKPALTFFTQTLLDWHRNDNQRQLPWKQNATPYSIWLSEIILQQTRVAQGIPYYERFIAAYPNIISLACASDNEVFRLWQGLGYYNRCRNLLHTARYIADTLKGVFPTRYEDILSLKGVGAYTAAAIASFAYDQPYAVVDGNVLRLLARYFGITTPIDSTEGKKQMAQLAQDLLSKEAPATYNQAIMDFGATVCTPALPQCDECPFATQCQAYKKDTVSLLPIKSKKALNKTRHFNYIIWESESKIWLQKREQKDIWRGLYEPFLIETPKPVTMKKLAALLQQRGMIMDQLKEAGASTQKLSHQTIKAQFYTSAVDDHPLKHKSKDGIWVRYEDLKKYAFPQTIVSFFKKNNYF